MISCNYVGFNAMEAFRPCNCEKGSHLLLLWGWASGQKSPQGLQAIHSSLEGGNCMALAKDYVPSEFIGVQFDMMALFLKGLCVVCTGRPTERLGLVDGEVQSAAQVFHDGV